MNATTRSALRTAAVAARALLVFTLVLGVGYTLLITVIGQLALPVQANGSLVRNADGEVVGSALIGQSFADAEGNPLPEYFQPRPSAAGEGYDGGASSGSNWGPENEELVSAIEERIAQIAQFNGVSPERVPADAVTASSSGLDPHISPEYARLQLPRVAEARGLAIKDVEQLLDEYSSDRVAGYIGEPTVNVVELNLALDQLEG